MGDTSIWPDLKCLMDFLWCTAIRRPPDQPNAKLSPESDLFFLPHAEHLKSLPGFLTAGHPPLYAACGAMCSPITDPTERLGNKKSNRCQGAGAFRHTTASLTSAAIHTSFHINSIDQEEKWVKTVGLCFSVSFVASKIRRLSYLTLTTSPPSTFISCRRFCCSRLVLERHFSKPRRSTMKDKEMKLISQSILLIVIQCEETQLRMTTKDYQNICRMASSDCRHPFLGPSTLSYSLSPSLIGNGRVDEACREEVRSGSV